jgi:hypothetical protein
VSIAALRACEPEARDGTQLEGLVERYLPLSAAPALERPFGMVFDPIETTAGPVLNFIAFGVRHQPRSWRAPTVYAIAHHRLHGRLPQP